MCNGRPKETHIGGGGLLSVKKLGFVQGMEGEQNQAWLSPSSAIPAAVEFPGPVTFGIVQQRVPSQPFLLFCGGLRKAVSSELLREGTWVPGVRLSLEAGISRQ